MKRVIKKVYEENQDIIWQRKVWAAGFCVLLGAVIAFAIVTAFFLIVKPGYEI
jgi:hypothetical protein